MTIFLGESAVSTESCVKALKNLTDICLQDVSVYPEGDMDFLNIGGLQDVKNILAATLEWPSKVLIVLLFIIILARMVLNFIKNTIPRIY